MPDPNYRILVKQQIAVRFDHKLSLLIGDLVKAGIPNNIYT